MSTSEVCPLCRCPNTEEHQASGWHKFNANLFKDGKMPIPLSSYEAFEAHRHEGQEQKTTATDNNHNHNIKSWHFSQLELSPWFLANLQTKAQQRLNYPLPTRPESIVQIRCTGMTGEAGVRTRKAKVVALFLADLKFEARCRIDDTTVVTAKNILVPEASSDDIDDITVTAIKPETEGAAYHNDVSKVIKAMKKDLVKILTEIFKEMNLWVKDPQADVVVIPTPISDWIAPTPVNSPVADDDNDLENNNNNDEEDNQPKNNQEEIEQVDDEPTPIATDQKQ